MSRSISVLVLLLFVVKAFTVPTNDTESWNGKWFPTDPSKEIGQNNALNNLPDANKAEANPKEKWTGEWFPNVPDKKHINNLIDANKTEASANEAWTGKLFPDLPNAKHTDSISMKKDEARSNDTWEGKWFPVGPNEQHTNSINMKKTEESSNGTWTGKWFPDIPNEAYNSPKRVHEANLYPDCDDGRRKIDVDFDPSNKIHSYKYLCLDHKDKYEPSFATFPIQREYIVPPAYEAPSYCLNETIEYDERLPTFGAHRYLVPKHGEYTFLPVQRWMSNLEYGAIVMLYHPCANKMQVEKLKHILNACLYRHVITPSTLLLPERPMALVAWSKSLEMSVVDERTAASFIKENAKNGPRTKQQDNQEYDAGLLVEAKLVTDESDSEICGNINF